MIWSADMMYVVCVFAVLFHCCAAHFRKCVYFRALDGGGVIGAAVMATIFVRIQLVCTHTHTRRVICVLRLMYTRQPYIQCYTRSMCNKRTNHTHTHTHTYDRLCTRNISAFSILFSPFSDKTFFFFCGEFSQFCFRNKFEIVPQRTTELVGMW